MRSVLIFNNRLFGFHSALTQIQLDQLIEINKIDCITPERCSVAIGSGEVDIFIPLLPARPKNKEQHVKEMEENGFIVDAFHINGVSKEIQYSPNIYIHKP